VRTIGTHPVAVISHRLWQRSLGGDPGIVNRDVSINGRPFTIIGVMPAEFGSAMIGLAFDIFIPVTMQSAVAPGSNLVGNRGSMWLDVMGRLKPGVTIERAREEIALVSRQIEADFPETGKDRTLGVFPLQESPLGVFDAIFSVVMVLAVVVGLVLLVACANVSNLLLARAAVRQKETAVRLALGAGRGRLMRQLLTESLILALLAGTAGLAIGSWTLRGMLSLVPDMDVPISFNTRMDVSVLAFTFGISLLTGIIFGFAPAVRMSNGMNRGGRQRLRSSLVVAQIAFSVIALISAGLFLRSLQRAYSTNLGFNPENVLMVSLDVFPNGYTAERGRSFYAKLLEEVRALPGVRSATLARRPPLTQRGARMTGLSEIEGYQPGPDEKLGFIYDTVGTDFFETMQIPLLRGRGFTDQDRAGAPQVVVVNESFARRYWPNQDPIGKRLRRGNTSIEVIGLAGDVKTRRITDSGLVFLYTTHQQVYEPDMTLIVRAADPVAVAEPIRQIVRSLDKDLALFGIMPMTTHVRTALSTQRAAASGTTVFALLALVLATIGVYGMVSYSVSQRTHEIGIRMALGAQHRDVYRLILGQGGRSVGLGLGLGLAASALVTRYLSSLLFGVRSSDPLTFAGISLLLLAAGTLACYLPARRATRVDPVSSLRHE
jgi:predicted permease